MERARLGALLESEDGGERWDFLSGKMMLHLILLHVSHAN